MEQIELYLEQSDEENIVTLRTCLEELCFQKKDTCLVIKLDKKPSKGLVYRIMELIFDYKTTLLKSITYPKDDHLRVLNKNFYNGETWRLTMPTILVGDIHQEASVYVYKSLYVHGKVEGYIYLMNEESVLYADEFKDAHLRFNHGVERIVSSENELWDYEKGGNKPWRVLSLLPAEKVE